MKEHLKELDEELNKTRVSIDKLKRYIFISNLLDRESVNLKLILYDDSSRFLEEFLYPDDILDKCLKSLIKEWVKNKIQEQEEEVLARKGAGESEIDRQT